MEQGRRTSETKGLRWAVSGDRSLDERRCSSRSNSQTSIDSVRPHSSMAMAVPRIRHDEAPPPLPPPRWNDELARGNDIAWKWGNSEHTGGFNKLAPIKPGSSLYGGYTDPRRLSVGEEGDDAEAMHVDDYPDRRGSTVSTIRSPSLAELRSESNLSNGIRRPPSPNTITNQRLQGERPLAQENLNRSSHAYDKHLLSRIGKSDSPPRQMRSESSDSTALARKLSLQTNQGGITHLPVTEVPASATEPVSRWVTSPLSAALSPSSRPDWRDYRMDYRSPSIDSLAPSMVLDSDSETRLRDSNRKSASGSLPGIEDALGSASRSQRESYDQVFLTENGFDLAGEESGPFRRLNLSDTTSSPAHRLSILTKPRMKRRALSPPTDVVRDDKVPAHSSEIYQRTPASAVSRSPMLRYHPKYGSVSSTSSSVRQNSYASSVGLSAGGSSMTSISSFDRHSPGALTPSESSQSSPFSTAPLPHTSANNYPTAFHRPAQFPTDTKLVVGMRKLPVQSSPGEPRPQIGNRVGGHHICECCPKKPKKFETEEALRLHEMEKQYSCQFCHNRFKNKNEAERHQNSLHLRRHSWSCAAISGFEAAFHASTSPALQGQSGPTHDTCGYCGQEFLNTPQPNWDHRIDHLTNVHKFAECNQAKKFFRADHFRQHLKHSHAGQSGKWTNMLENACMREESPADAASESPTGSDPGRGPSSLPPLGEPPMGGATIRESQDES